MHSGFVAKVSLSLGSTYPCRAVAEDHYQAALKQDRQGNVIKAEQSYTKAIENMQEAYGRYPKKYKVCQLLAEIHFKYGLLLEKQANKVTETEENYQKAEQHIATANDSKSHDNDIHRLTHDILSQYASFLCTQGKREEAKVRFKKAGLFAPQTLLSDRIDNPAFNAHLAQFTHYSAPFFSVAAPCSQALFSPPIPSKEEADGVIQAFEKTRLKGLSDVQELASLTALNDVNVYSALTRALLSGVQPKENIPLNPFLLGGLSVVMDRRAQFEQEDSQLISDMVRSLGALVDLLENMQISKNHRQVEIVLQMLSLLLDQMVYFNVKGLERETVTRLHTKLDQIKDEKQLVLNWRVQYIRQALRRVPNNANFLQALQEKLPPAVGGFIYLGTFGLKVTAGATSGGVVGGLEIDKLWEAFKCFNEAFKGHNQKKYESWYGALRLLDLLIETNHIEKIGKLLSPANQISNPWANQLLTNEWFLRGLCDRLERLAYSSHPATRDDALRLLKGFKEGQIASVPYGDVKNYALACLNRIARIWPQPNVEQIEAAGHFPPVWHPFWRENISQALLNQVREKAKRSEYFGLIPGIRENVIAIHQHFKPIPLSELLFQVKTALAQHYESALKIKRISGKELDLEDCYINLAIVKSQAQQEADREKRQSKFYRPSSYEEIQGTNLQEEPIPLEKLFDACKLSGDTEGTCNRILIQGRAGIGKTTLCKKLVHEYQKGLWQDRFDAVLWLPLRELKTYDTYRLEELLKHKYFSQHTECEHLAQQLSRHSGKILFILDGLDEIVADLDKNVRLKDFLDHLFKQPHLIVTSRPAGVNPSKLKVFNLHLETIGFSQENVRTYLEKVEPEFATEIQEAMERTPFIRELGNTPVQLDALCYSWPEVKAAIQKGATVTMTMLYQAMVDKLWRKDAERLSKESGGKALQTADLRQASSTKVARLMADEIDYLSYLGFRGLQDNLIEFDLTYLRKVTDALEAAREKELSGTLQRDIKDTSFLHTVNTNLDEDKHAYHFLHLTFQEFFAAKFLVQHFRAYLTAEGAYKTQAEVIQKGLVLELKALQDFVGQHKYNPRYQIVWRMVTGLLEGETLEGFFKLLEEKPRDLLGGAHVYLITHCLHEARTRLSEPTIQRLEKVLEEGLQLELKLKGEYEGKTIGSRLGRLPAFPEHLLLKLFESNKQHSQYRWDIFSDLERRPTVSDKALAILSGAPEDEDTYDSHGRNSEKTVEALLNRQLLQEEDFLTAMLADRALRFKAEKSEQVRDALLTHLEKEDEITTIKWGAVSALGPSAVNSTQVRDALLRRLEKDEHPKIREEAARALGPTAANSARVRDALLTLLEKDKDLEVRKWAAHALGSHAANFEEIQEALLTLLAKDKDPNIIQAAARALGPSAADSARVQKALLTLLEKDKDPEVRWETTQALGPSAANSARVQKALLTLLEKEDDDPTIKWGTARALGPSAANSARVQKALLKQLGKNKPPQLRLEAAQALSSHAVNFEEIQKALLTRLEKDKDPKVIWEAASVLGPHAANSKEIRDALLKRLKENEDPRVREGAASALGKYAMNSKEVLDAVINLLGTTYAANAAYHILSGSGNTAQAYRVLPDLSFDQLQKFYTEFLFSCNSNINSPLYCQDDYQGKALHFYTATGLGEPIPISDEQAHNIAQAFEQARKNACAAFLSEEAALESERAIDEEMESKNNLSLARELSFTEE